MKRVSFWEHTQVYYPIVHGQISCVKKESLSSEEEVLKRRSSFQKLRRDMRSTLCLYVIVYVSSPASSSTLSSGVGEGTNSLHMP